MTGNETIEDTQRAILMLEQDWAAAIQRRDAAAMEHFLAESYFLAIGVQGQTLQVVPRAAWLNNLPQYVTESFRMDDAQVRVYGEVAVVLMLYTQKAVVRGQDRSGQFVITDIWVKQADGWRVAARHSSRPEAPAITRPQ